jgi:hypothetical protein
MHRPSPQERSTYARAEAVRLGCSVRAARKRRQRLGGSEQSATMPRALPYEMRESRFQPIRPCLFRQWRRRHA